LSRFEGSLRDGVAGFTTALAIGYQDGRASREFGECRDDLCDDLRRVLDAVERMYDYRERLHDLVMIDSEEFAIGGGPGFKARRDKAWDRAREPFEP
jgi:hypothetical protein